MMSGHQADRVNDSKLIFFLGHFFGLLKKARNIADAFVGFLNTAAAKKACVWFLFVFSGPVVWQCAASPSIDFSF